MKYTTITFSFTVVVMLLLTACDDLHKSKNKQAGQATDTQQKVEAKSAYSPVNTWLDDFKNFRIAVYQQDVAKMKSYFDFPVNADTTQIWTAVYENMKESERPKADPAVFTAADLEKHHQKLFNAAFIQSLLKVKSEQLYQKGEYSTSKIQKGDQSYYMLAHYDKATATLQLSVMLGGWKDENGEEMSEGESAIIYFFKVAEDKYLKFDKILFAG